MSDKSINGIFPMFHAKSNIDYCKGYFLWKCIDLKGKLAIHNMWGGKFPIMKDLKDIYQLNPYFFNEIISKKKNGDNSC